MADPKTFAILDVEGFTVSQPYEEGRVVTAAEAKALNQLRKENLGNNFRAKVQAYLDANEGKVEFAEGAPRTEAELLDAFAKLDQDYVFTLANVSAARKLDPVERKARTIARGVVKDNLATIGAKVGTAPEGWTEEEWKDKIESLVDEVAARDDILAMAKAAVKAESKAVGLTLEGLNLNKQ